MGRKWKERKGFTLVELVVVLVILVVLIAMLVPALTGYIRRAQERAALAECRACVVSAQTQASEVYGLNDFAAWSASGNAGTRRSEVTTLAEVGGQITEDTYGDNAAVTRLVYTVDGITVIYENKEYRIEGESTGGGSGSSGGTGGSGGTTEPQENTLGYDSSAGLFTGAEDALEIAKEELLKKDLNSQGRAYLEETEANALMGRILSQLGMENVDAAYNQNYRPKICVDEGSGHYAVGFGVRINGKIYHLMLFEDADGSKVYQREGHTSLNYDDLESYWKNGADTDWTELQ